MYLESIRAYALTIPLSRRSTTPQNTQTQALWVEARTRSGILGFGEGCPRAYATMEQVHSAAAFVSRHASTWIGTVHDLAGLRRWLRENRAEVDANPSAWAAVELALLDVLAREQNQSIEALLGLPALAGYFRYTGVLSDAAPDAFQTELARYLRAEFCDFKIQLSGDPSRDLAKVRMLRAAGVPAERVRADANKLWTETTAAMAYLRKLDFDFNAIEEPLQPDDFAGLTELGAATGMAIVRDATLLDAGQLAQMQRTPELWMINLRVSKLGGLLRSLDLVDAVRSSGCKLVIGADVGETSLLTRTALTVANSARDVVIAQEGALGTHLLAHDVVDPSLMFGRGGLLRIPTRALSHHSGLGMTVTRPVLRLAPLVTVH